MASSKELDEISKIWLLGNLEAHDFIPAAYWKTHYNEVRAALGKANLLVDVRDNKITGFLGLTGDYIAGLFIKNDYRGLGIETALLNAAKADFSQLSLSVYIKNRVAYQFYLRNGFSVMTTRIDTNTGEAEYQMSWSSE